MDEFAVLLQFLGGLILTVVSFLTAFQETIVTEGVPEELHSKVSFGNTTLTKSGARLSMYGLIGTSLLLVGFVTSLRAAQIKHTELIDEKNQTQQSWDSALVNLQQVIKSAERLQSYSELQLMHLPNYNLSGTAVLNFNDLYSQRDGEHFPGAVNKVRDAFFEDVNVDELSIKSSEDFDIYRFPNHSLLVRTKAPWDTLLLSRRAPSFFRGDLRMTIDFYREKTRLASFSTKILPNNGQETEFRYYCRDSTLIVAFTLPNQIVGGFSAATTLADLENCDAVVSFHLVNRAEKSKLALTSQLELASLTFSNKNDRSIRYHLAAEKMSPKEVFDGSFIAKTGSLVLQSPTTSSETRPY